jgi:large subunit ribosomal protein L30
MKSTITVTLVKSLNGKTQKIKSCITGLGLRKINQSSTLENTPSIRGMVKKAIHMLKVEE